MTPPAIVVSHVSKQFRRYHPDRPWTLQEALAQGWRRLRPVETFWGLRDVSFTVGVGRTVGIIGANGSGKSTLLRLIGGVGRPDGGRIAVRGRIGALLDLGAGFHPDLTGRENAVLAGVLAGLTREEVMGRLDAIVAFAEVEKFIDNPLRTYSTGMQMRLAFSTAVHADPEVLLIDEVLSVGDVAFQRKCLDRIEQFKARGCSILLVSHEASAIRDICDEALWLHGGHLMALGAAPEVVRHYLVHITGGEPAAELLDDVPAPPGVSPHPTVRTRDGAEVVLDEQRFGSVELQIADVRVLEHDGQHAGDFRPGEPVNIEIAYQVTERLVGPIFAVRFLRGDGVVCVDLNSEMSALSASVIEGAGTAILHIERLDLAEGTYTIDVACYANGWTYAYDYRASVHTLTVGRGEPTSAVLSAPHHWEVSGVEQAEP